MVSRKRERKRGEFSSVSISTDAPGCPHGPKMCFIRKCDGSAIYRCSAFRNVSACSRDIKQAETIRNQSLNGGDLSSYNREDRCYCHSCQSLFIRHTSGVDHTNHKATYGIPTPMLKMPSYFLNPLEESSEHAQYFFSHDWLNFMVIVLRVLRIDNILCVGAPRFFDFLTACTRNNFSIPKFLLDLDFRLEKFYPPSSFARFSALNGHFFTTEGETSCMAFMQSCKGRTVVFCDPPFGAYMETLVATLRRLKCDIVSHGDHREVFLMVTIPYFIGKKLIQAAPELKMLDYKVTYEKHARFMSSVLNENNSKRSLSIVRLFTDAPPSEIPPPNSLEKSFRFCGLCQRYSDKQNRHCSACGFCSTLHGQTYNHCNDCQRCRPPSYGHCSKCNRCHKPHQHDDHENDTIGGEENHKTKRRKFSRK